MAWSEPPPPPEDLEWYEPDFDYHDAIAEYDAQVIAEGIDEQQRERARRYLSLCGDAAWRRVERCLAEAEALLPDHPGPSLAVCVTGAELMIRYLVLRPLVAGLVFSDSLASRLIDDPFRRRQHLDRDLLPMACAAWDIDLTAITVGDQTHAWPTLKGAWAVRNEFVHKGDEVEVGHAEMAIRCTRALLAELVTPLSKRLGLAWPDGAWSIDGKLRDPIQADREVWGS